MADDFNLKLEALRNAKASVRAIILTESEKRVQANISRVDALNQRLSALCALLFAGAAVSATFTTNVEKVADVAIYLACGASVLFAVAGAIGCSGLFSKQTIFPGEAPSWWTLQGAKTLADLTEDDAKLWLIERHELMVASLTESVSRRAKAFNRAVVLGACAGGLVALAAVATTVMGPLVGQERSPAISSVTIR